MANGKPSDLPENILHSGVRSGLKREFAFALKSQAELPNSLGRTRSGKPSVKTPDAARSGGRKKAAILCVPPVGSIVLGISAESPMDVDCSQTGGVAIDVPTADAGNKEELEKDEMEVEKPKEDRRKLMLEVCVEDSTTSSSLFSPRLELIAAGASEAIKSSLENGSVAEQSNNESKIVKELAEKPKRRFTRSALKLNPSAETSPKVEQEETPADVKLRKRFTRSKLKAMSPTASTSFSIERENQGNIMPVAESPLAFQQENLVEISVVVDSCGGLDFENGRLDESIKDKHEGSVSVTRISELDYDNGIYGPVTPASMFTRDLLADAIEESAVAIGSALNESPSATSKKMELKMSKMITLAKFPSNVRELLGTGLLEGLPVKYISCPECRA